MGCPKHNLNLIQFAAEAGWSLTDAGSFVTKSGLVFKLFKIFGGFNLFLIVFNPHCPCRPLRSGFSKVELPGHTSLMGFETALWPFLDLKKIKSPEN